MIRFKWIIIRTSAKFDDLANMLIENSFIENSTSGFLVNLVNNDYIEGDFVQRTINKEKIIRPDTTEDIIEIERFNYLRFNISYVKESYYLISLINPPRKIFDFLNYINFHLGTRIIVIPVELDVMDVIGFIRSDKKTKSLSIKKIKVSAIELSVRSSASIEIQSHDNAHEEFMKNFSFDKFIVDNVKALAIYDGRKINLSIKKTGVSSEGIDITFIIKEIICKGNLDV